MKMANIVKSKAAQLAIAATTAIVSGAAAAQSAPPTLDSVLTTLLASLAEGIGVTIAKIAPILALTFGLGFAWNWIKKNAK